jgi:hypothetical protein
MNHGAGASMDYGLKLATCEYLCILGADDYFLPNRFDAEKKIFTEIPDADGVYGALGVHYYSEIAKEQFKSKFNNEITTVTNSLEPNLVFDGLLGLDRRWKGYFSLDAFTFKKTVLEKLSYYINHDLRLHQDTEFILRLSFYNKLYPGNIGEAIAMRGVHEDNRITKAINNNIFYSNQHKLYMHLNKWIQRTDAKPYQKKAIDSFFKSTTIPTVNNYLLRWIYFIKNVFSNKYVFIIEKNYMRYHKFLFGENIIGSVILKIRYRLLSFFKVSQFFYH